MTSNKGHQTLSTSTFHIRPLSKHYIHCSRKACILRKIFSQYIYIYLELYTLPITHVYKTEF